MNRPPLQAPSARWLRSGIDTEDYGGPLDAEAPVLGRRLALLAGPVHPARRRARRRRRRRHRDLLDQRAGGHPDGRADGPRDGGAGRALGPGHRRAAQRDVRQRARADHRAVRAARGAPGGRQGLARRLDPRQHPARAGGVDARRRTAPSAPGLRPHRGRGAGADAAPGGGRACDAGDLPARSGPRPARSDGQGGALQRRHRAPVRCGRDRPAPHLRRGAVLLAQDPPRALQPGALRRGGGGRAVVGAQVRDHARDRRRGGRRDVRDPRGLDHGGVEVDRAVAVLRRRHRGRDRRQRGRALGRGLLREQGQDGPLGQHRDRLERPDRALRGARARAPLTRPRGLPDGARLQRPRAGRAVPCGARRAGGDERGRVDVVRGPPDALGLRRARLHVLLRLMAGALPWLALAALTVFLLWVDLHFFARGREPTFREGVVWSIGWLVVSVLAGTALLFLDTHGVEDFVTYTTVYFVERSLSLDNLFVFLLL